MIDLNQVSLALRNCTSRSLILLDEFGKGTSSTGQYRCIINLNYRMLHMSDGAGLFCGVLKHLLNRGANCPKVLAATHFHEVFSKKFLNPDSLPITFLHMEVLFTCNDGDLLNLEELVTSDTHTGKGESRETPCAPLLGERITYLYRCNHMPHSSDAITDSIDSVAPGLAYSSNAAQCAAIFGLPGSTVARAQYVR